MACHPVFALQANQITRLLVKSPPGLWETSWLAVMLLLADVHPGLKLIAAGAGGWLWRRATRSPG